MIELSKEQLKLLYLLFFTSICTYFTIGGLSWSFYFGLLLLFPILKNHSFFQSWKGNVRLLVWYCIVCFISFLFSEIDIALSDIVKQIQIIYWLLILILIYKIYPQLVINQQSFIKVISFSIILLAILYVGPKYLLYGGIEGKTIFGVSQNGASFAFVMFYPYVQSLFKKKWKKIFCGIFFFVILLLNGSRTGGLVIIVQTLFIYIIATPILKKYIVQFFVFLILLFTIGNVEPLRIGFGKFIQPINEEFADLLINTDEVMMTDKSWMIRKIQVQKGKQIITKYPLLGVGPFMFSRYTEDTNLNEIESNINLSKLDYENRSSHNSYISVLAETGWLGFFFWLSFFIFSFFVFIKYRKYLGANLESCAFISLIGMLIYFYTISAHVGTSTWLSMGLIAGAVARLKKHKI